MTTTVTTAKPGESKPLPVIDDDNRPFWSAVQQGKLCMQRCGACSHIRYPISNVCPECLEGRFEWIALSGRGTVFSTIVFHQIYHQGFAGDAPYNVSLIQLEEGPRMFSNVVGIAPSDVKVGDAVAVFSDPISADVSLPRFRLAAVPIN